jgi:hypothetical protein
MGVKFTRLKLTTNATTGQSNIQEYSDASKPPLHPLVSIKRINIEGRAQKYSMPYTQTNEKGVKIYKTVWQPIGQEGWIVKLQVILIYSNDTGVNEIGNWLTVDSGEILQVVSNIANRQDEIDPSIHLPYNDLSDGSKWYVDHILITSVRGNPQIAMMELTLIRCWQ